MTVYNAPIKDMMFVLQELFNVDEFWQKYPGTQDFNTELASAVLEESGKLSRDVLFPLFRSGDEEGCHFDNGKVTTPEGFKEAYKQLSEGGWCGLGGSPEYDGQGLPKMLVVLFEEMLFGSNNSFALYPILSSGGAMCLMKHGSQELKDMYMSKLYTGEWSTAMGLTEPHCGTDLALLKTKAEPSGDGSFNITGTKIFITAGEHDLCDNIVHLVLAKLPDAPDGVKGISLFLAPKYFVDGDGNLGERNSFSAGSIEHKMGIKGSATCVMNYDGAKAWLVGEPGQGLAAMFTMMNYERLSIGLQGLGSAEMAYQMARDYAKDRLQGRALSIVDKSKPADPIIHHADVRRMLLFVRASVEAGRAFTAYVANNLDISHFSNNDEEVKRANDLIALLIPVAKAFMTDKGLEACVQAQQVFGGHGYIREWGVEQLVRDVRIAQIYEGTNGIQALDLMGRKVVRSKGELNKPFYYDIQSFLDSDDAKLNPSYAQALEKLLTAHKKATEFVMKSSASNADEIGAASVDYLHMTGYLAYAWMWAKMCSVANSKKDEDFYAAKMHTGQFFFEKMLPQAYAHYDQIMNGCSATMAMPVDLF